jgi:hypothetical protein
MKNMKFLRTALTALAVAGGSLAVMGTASAVPINTTFNFVPTTGLTANTGNVTTATSITSGAPLLVTSIVTDNTGLFALISHVSLTNPTPVTLGATFVKSWTTLLGTFTANLTVTDVTRGTTALDIDATGTVTSTNPLFSATPDFYSASYTQNGGPGSQINASFNNSTTPPPQVPEPASIALLGVGLLGLGFVANRKRGA